MDEWKLCPFCGRGVQIYLAEDSTWKIVHSNPLAAAKARCPITETISYMTYDDAFAAWNTRYELTCKPVMMDIECDDGSAAGEIEVCSRCGIPWETEWEWYYCPSCGSKVVE